MLDNGLTLPNGLNLANGFNLANGVNLANGINLANGVDALNGINLANGAPSIAPPVGSGLEQWIDEDPAMRLRTVQYLIECAMPPGSQVDILYREKSFTYAGRIGLAPSWRAGEMSSAEQEKVSSCLLARINSEAKVVIVDLFGPMPGFNTATHAELDAFPASEGVFFGNLFLPEPQAYACGLAALSLDEFRACTASDCGIITVIGQGEDPSVLASCYQARLCAWRSLGNSYDYASSCTYGGATWRYPITTQLALAAEGQECYGSYQCAKGLDCVEDFCR